MLALDDPRWSSLAHVYGPATDIPGLLRDLSAAPAFSKKRDRAWESLWSALCHQGTIGTASYAAVPHVVSLGADRSVGEQVMHWTFVGAVARSDDAPPIPEFLRADYEAALATTREKVLGCLARGVSETDAAWMLISLASINGRRTLANSLEGLLVDGELTLECPECGEELSITDTEDVSDTGKRGKELAYFAERARSAGHDELAERVLSLQGFVSCPECEEPVPLLPEET